MIILFGLLVWLIIEIVFFILHRNPLNEEEILKLSQKRTRKYIKKNYTFNNVPVAVNKQFKSSLKPNGCWYNVNERLATFPSYVAALLKGKKHEWVVLAIEKEGIVYGFYANKGYDNSSVSFNCDLDYIMEKCKEYGCSTIIRFHNHPNENPNHQTCLLASEQDKSSALWCCSQVNHSYNWMDFVCERGNFIKFFEKYSPAFTPKIASSEYIQTENNLSQFKNYKLHRELGLLHYSKSKKEETIGNNLNGTKQQIHMPQQTPKKRMPMREKLKIALIVILCLSLKWGIIGLITGNDTQNIDTNTTTANSVVEESATNETTLKIESSTYIEESKSETTNVPIISDKESMISQFQSLGLTKEEAEDAQEIFENVGITKISNIEVVSGTQNGVAGEVQYKCNLFNFQYEDGIKVSFKIVNRKIKGVAISFVYNKRYPDYNQYMQLTLLDGITEEGPGDAIILFNRKLKNYLQVDENYNGYKAVYDYATHSIRRY